MPAHYCLHILSGLCNKKFNVKMTLVLRRIDIDKNLKFIIRQNFIFLALLANYRVNKKKLYNSYNSFLKSYKE